MKVGRWRWDGDGMWSKGREGKEGLFYFVLFWWVYKMRMKDVEIALSDVEGFERPKVELEQYKTSAHIATVLAHTMETQFDDVAGNVICDLGCGSGMLSMACALFGAQLVVGIDVDDDALAAAQRNLIATETDSSVELLRADVLAPAWTPQRVAFDVVVMNPPFGTRRRGADVRFLDAAAALPVRAIYSMHKRSTRDFISRWARPRELRAEVSFLSSPSTIRVSAH